MKQSYPELANFLIENSSEKSEAKKKDLNLNANNFIYLNNKTSKYEGVSMHSSYSVVQLTKDNILTLSTSNNLNSKLKEPFYHQLVYTIKISPFSRAENKKDLVELLNEQSIEGSRLRVSVIRKLSEILNLAPTSVRINWIEKVKINEDDLLRETLDDKQENANKNFNDEEDDLDEDDADNEEFLSKEKDNEDTDYNYDVDTHVEPEFISEFSAERLRKLNANRKNQYLIVISFSDLKLLEIQNEYLSRRKLLADSLEQIQAGYQTNCNDFFKSIKQKHLDVLKTSYKLLNNFETKQIEFIEKIKRVQLVKLCDLNQLASSQKIDLKHTLNQTRSSILNSLLSSKLTSLIRNTTEEINFFSSNLDYLDTVNSNETTFIDDVHSNLLIQYKENANNSSKIEEQHDKSNMYQIKYEIISNITSKTNQTAYNSQNSTQKYLIWSIIPEEDLLLAVIVPCVIIVSMTVMTIIVICLLQMYNNEKTDPRDFASVAHSSQNSNLTNLTTDKHTYKPTTLHKEKAFLSKGVPVILYEEMGEKPLDDYDDTHKDTSECANFRSPSTFRNEKPPAPLTPAPPQYSRSHNQNSSPTSASNYSEEKEPLFSNSYADKKKNAASIKHQIQQLNYILP